MDEKSKFVRTIKGISPYKIFSVIAFFLNVLSYFYLRSVFLIIKRALEFWRFSYPRVTKTAMAFFLADAYHGTLYLLLILLVIAFIGIKTKIYQDRKAMEILSLNYLTHSILFFIIAVILAAIVTPFVFGGP